MTKLRTLLIWNLIYIGAFSLSPIQSERLKKHPPIKSMSLEAFRTEFRRKACVPETLCFNTWLLPSRTGEKFALGMLSPERFGRVKEQENDLSLASEKGTLLHAILFEGERGCDVIAKQVQSAGGWEFIKVRKDQNPLSGNIFEQRWFKENKKGQQIDVIHHCLPFADYTVSTIAWIHPDDDLMTFDRTTKMLSSMEVIRIKEKK